MKRLWFNTIKQKKFRREMTFLGQSSVLVLLISALICRPCLGRSGCCSISYACDFSHCFGCLTLKSTSDAWILWISHPHGGCRFWGVVAALPGPRRRWHGAPSPCPPPEPLQPCALVSLTRRLTAIAWNFSCFFSFSPTNMCFQYPSEPSSWRPLLLSPALILLPGSLIARLGLALAPRLRLRGLRFPAPVSEPASGSHVPSCHRTEISRGMNEGGQTPPGGRSRWEILLLREPEQALGFLSAPL